MARDRYLWNAGEEEINDASKVIRADTPKSKWDNFWFYHKTHVIVGILIVLIVSWFIYDLASKVDPDYQIGIITNSSYPSETLDKLGEQLALHAEDLNGDGQVVVQVNGYPMAIGSDSTSEVDANTQMASVTRFSVDVQSGHSIIFMADEESFRNVMEMYSLWSYLDGTNPEEGAEDYENMRIAWSEAKGLNSLDLSVSENSLYSNEAVDALMDRLYIGLRCFEGTAIEDDPEKQAYYEKSKALFDWMITGEDAG